MAKKTLTASAAPSVASAAWQVSNTTLALLSLGLAAAYYGYSLLADGFYQQDEAAHFLSMRGFWFEPNSILSNWAKPGYKLLYALPALLGSEAVAAVNCLVAAFACFLAYQVAKQAGSQMPLLAFLGLATMPLWVNLGFRNYSEIVSGLLLALAVWLQLRGKLLASALTMSYIAFIRQEFYPLLGLYFLYLAWQKQWLPAVLLGLFPLAQNLWGTAISGDWLYLLNQILKTSAEIGGAFPRKGFEHYFLMSITIFGSVAVALAVAYLAMLGISRWQKVPPTPRDRDEVFIWLPVVLYFLMYCIFNTHALNLGPSGGGNLRYLLVVAPLVAALMPLAVEKFRDYAFKGALLGTMAVFALLVALFMTYQHNYVVFTEGRDWLPFIGVLLTLVVLLLGQAPRGALLSLAGLLLFLALVSVRPIKRSPEDQACQQLAEWYTDFERQNGARPLYLHHDMFYYFLGRTRYEFATRPKFITDANAQAAPKGSIFIWDSHYSFRPELRKESISYEYFVQKPSEYRLIHQLMSEDETFGVLIFEKK